MTKRTNVPDLDELESLERDGLLERRPTHSRLLAKLRAERAIEAELALERVSIDADLEEQRRRASIEHIVLPIDGSDDDALLVSLRGLGGNSPPLAVEQRDERTLEVRAADCSAFVNATLWKEHKPQVLETLRRTHPSRPYEPSHYVVVEPGAPRGDLLALIAATEEPYMMPRSVFVENLARALPLTSTVAGWYAKGIESRDPDAARFCHVLRRRFVAANLDAMLVPSATAAE